MSVAKKNTIRDAFTHSQLPDTNKIPTRQKSSSSSSINEEEERKRLSRELHDGLGQLLTTIGLQVKQCLNHYDSNSFPSLSPHDHKASLQQISTMVKEAIGEVRSICSAIRPSILDDLGVLAAISWQCRQISKAAPSLKIVTDYRIEEDQIPVAYRTAIYRIVQESLNNALKYSRASRIGVTLSLQDESVHLSVIDNGIGFDIASIHKGLGLGLMSMRERVESVNGKLEIAAAVNSGVEIQAYFPLRTMTLCDI
ncbi:MAG: hypothetical protein DBP01_16595 [gamma proteobacterium symbiont of Ctena orbiculata]|nr:MAG: hypothetical protein DBP01_16595 [gamma proteobacterium symbiont of Ctena orbiculata]